MRNLEVPPNIPAGFSSLAMRLLKNLRALYVAQCDLHNRHAVSFSITQAQDTSSLGSDKIISDIQAVCLAACKKLHEMGAFTDMLLPDKGSGEEGKDVDQNDEGDPLPGTARHREFYPEGVADILQVYTTCM